MCYGIYANSQLILIMYLCTYRVRAVIGAGWTAAYSESPFTAAISVRDIFFFFQSQDRGMQKESEHTRQFGQLFDHFAPKRQPLLFSADRIDKRGSPGVLRRDVPSGTRWNKQKKKEKRENDTESGKGEKERLSQSVPCSSNNGTHSLF